MILTFHGASMKITESCSGLVRIGDILTYGK